MSLMRVPAYDIRGALVANDFVVYVAKNIDEYLRVLSQLSFFAEDIRIIKFPPWDTEPYRRASPSSSVVGQRLKSLFELNDRFSKKAVFITTISALMQKIPPVEELLSSVLDLKVGSTFDRAEVVKNLICGGYERNGIAIAEGSFAVRGSILDIIDHEQQGWRIDFFGSKIDSIKKFDAVTQLSTVRADNLIIYPISEIIFDDQHIKKFQHNYLKLFGVSDSSMYQETLNGLKNQGLESWLPMFYETLTDIFEYLPKHALFIERHISQIDLQQLHLSIEESYNARLNENDKSYPSLEPSKLYLDLQNTAVKLSTVCKFESSTYSDPNLILKQIIKSNNQENLEAILDFQRETGRKVLICGSSDDNVNKLKNLMNARGVFCQSISSYKELLAVKDGISIALLDINGYFILEETLFVPDYLFVKRAANKEYKKKSKHTNSIQFFQELISIEPGDLLVHAEYGIGRFQGIKNLSVKNAAHDFIEILYSDDDKLYLPVENLELISRYGEDNQHVALDKLGSIAWQSRKAKLKERIKIAASALIAVAAKREAYDAAILEPIHEYYQQFCDRFSYITTADQESAIEDVVNDLKAGKPMDRLVCADVGFGKTEVALRASACATLGLEKVQVAVVVPTTLLARQHYATFLSRFNGLPVVVKQLSKFTKKNEVTSIKHQMAKGEVDVVIGTHALLANDVNFKKLGLLIIDEEQHFGVGQKEKLKKLKESVHVLTLSATPIPRTLQMSLVNIKSLSIIATPPANRQPVKTHVIPYDPFIVRDALMKEKARGGLSFYVTPRVQYLDEIEIQLCKIVPELKVAKAHGSMSSTQLDKIMNDFYDHKFDVLLSTSIVESGLDVASANTIIIDRANMFGLAQLYQMKGRVGRSDVLAYAYMTTLKNKLISGVARKRLEIIQSLQALGSGFSIATHDMDNRGYGNLLGDEQSGHIKEVGIELYQKMLADAIEQMQGTEIINSDWSPVINIGLPVQIPQTYIDDESLRLSIYRQIADIVDEEECDKFTAMMHDRFGPLPNEVKNLFEVIKIKQLAKAASISKIESGDNGMIFSFKEGNAMHPSKIMNIIAAEREFEAKLKSDGKLLFLKRSSDYTYDKGDTAKRILRTCLN